MPGKTSSNWGALLGSRGLPADQRATLDYVVHADWPGRSQRLLDAAGFATVISARRRQYIAEREMLPSKRGPRGQTIMYG
jgi:hypothetical protein